MEINMRLLIAEDDPDDQFLIQRVAREVCPPDLRMDFVEDGIKLIDFLQERGKAADMPALIVMDLNMPRKDGRQAIREIKNDPRLAQIPMVVLTTSSLPEDKQYCQRLGVAAFYRKPGSLSEFRTIMGEICAEYLGPCG